MQSTFLPNGTIYKLGRYVKKVSKAESEDCILWREGKINETDKPVLVKIEKIDTQVPRLHLEYRYLKLLSSTGLVPELLHYGPYMDSYALITTMLGKTLDEVFLEKRKPFDLRSVTYIAIECINLLEALHAHGLVHRKVSPEAFQLGPVETDQPQKLFLTDLGLAKVYLERRNQHAEFYQYSYLIGVPRYMSLHAHQMKEQSRRDDMESLGYVLIYLSRGSLPWQGVKANSSEEVHRSIGEVKSSTPLEKLCDGLPSEFFEYMNTVRKLDYVQRPDYDYLKKLFQGLGEQNNFWDSPFDLSCISFKQ